MLIYLSATFESVPTHVATDALEDMAQRAAIKKRG
jgi:hypothetical protein